MPLSWAMTLAYSGRFGVELFFVLSGFILALPFARRTFADLPPPDLRAYYFRRVTRLEPPYLVSLILCFLLLVRRSGEAWTHVPNLLASMLYGHSLVYGQGSIINPVTWSLEVEIQFYLLVPLLVRVFDVRTVPVRRVVMIGAMLGFALFSQWFVVTSDLPRLRNTLLNYIQYFLGGFLLADCYLTGALTAAEAPGRGTSPRSPPSRASWWW